MDYQPRLNKKCKPVFYCILCFEKVLLWKVIRCSSQFFYFLFCISFYIKRYHFLQLFRTLLCIIWKIFWSQVFLFNKFNQTPRPLNDQNLLSVTNVFCQFSLKCLLKYFFWVGLHNPAKAPLYISSELLLYIFFKGSNYRFTVLLFRTYFKNSCLDSSISNYL